MFCDQTFLQGKNNNIIFCFLLRKADKKSITVKKSMLGVRHELMIV